MDELERRQREHDLEYETHISKVLEIRRTDKPSSKPWWLRMLETPGGAALITVLIGGLLGGWISSIIQSGAKDREFQQAWLKARGDQAMLAYKDFVEKRSNLITELYGRVGSSVSASDDLINLSRKDFTALPELEPEVKTARKEYQKSIDDRFEQVEADWRKDRDRLGLLIDFYHPDQKPLVEAWGTVTESLTGYMRCAKKWREGHVGDEENLDKACTTERSVLTTSLRAFSEEISKKRTYLWQGWDDPKELRKVLEAN
jgi:hypothetical protein